MGSRLTGGAAHGAASRCFLLFGRLGRLGLLGLLASGCCCVSGGPLGFWGIQDDVVEKVQDISLRAEIRDLERTKGPEASQRLLAIYGGTKGSLKVQGEALRALGRLGRREDVPALLEMSRWNDLGPRGTRVPSEFPWIMPVLADIGGPEACAALAGFLQDRLVRLAYDGVGHSVDVQDLAAAVEKAQCLPQEEVRAVVRRYAEDLWVAGSVQLPALRFLAERGDPWAAARLTEYEELKQIVDPAEIERLLLRTDVPWWLRWRKMDYLSLYSPRWMLPAGQVHVGGGTAPLSRENLLDTYFALLGSVYQAAPPRPDDFRYKFQNWVDRICRNEQAAWVRGDPAEYFRAKRAQFREALPPEEFERMDRWLRYAEDSNVYWEQERAWAAAGGYPAPRPTGPESPDW